MELSRSTLKQFASITNDSGEVSSEATVNATVKEVENDIYVQIDGSDQLTPIDTTVDVKSGERVLVLLKNHTATITGNKSSPAARLEELRALGDEVTEFGIVLANQVNAAEINTAKLTAAEANIESLFASDVTISNQLNANSATIKELSADNATITGKLEAAEADIKELETDNVNVKGRLTAAEADIVDLEAKTAKIDILEADVADIDTLIFGSASGNVIQTSFANAVIAQLGDAQIKSAMIADVSADKITAGDIITNNVRVRSEDGSLLISDETIQISDDTRVRVQIGKDESDDYSINIWDADGNLMFSQGGITDAAIKDAIIRNDMVASDANIAASKLDISSLFTEINNSTETIKSTKIYLDEENQTLDVAFKTMSSDVDELSNDVTTQGTALSVVQGQISSKIWMEDIKDTDVGELAGDITILQTQYTELNQTVSGLSTTVGEHTTQISNRVEATAADDGNGNVVVAMSALASDNGEYNATIISNRDRITRLETDLDGFRTEVSDTYVTKDEMGEIVTVEQMESAIEQSANSITLSVSETYQTKDDMSGYYTIEQANSAIDMKADSIILSVSETYQTKDAMSGYPTTEQMNSAIEQSANSITQTVSETYQTKDDMSGYYTIEQANSAITQEANKITQTVSETYQTKDDMSEYPTTVEMTSAIEQTASSITSTVNGLEGRVSTWEQTSEGFELRLDGVEGDISDAKTAAETAQSAADDASAAAEAASSDAADAKAAANEAIVAADDAAKTATNYITGNSSGLVVGYQVDGTLGRNVQLTSTDVNIRNGSTTLASFGANYISLGVNSSSSVINMCKDAGTIEAYNSGIVIQGNTDYKPSMVVDNYGAFLWSSNADKGGLPWSKVNCFDNGVGLQLYSFDGPVDIMASNYADINLEADGDINFTVGYTTWSPYFNGGDSLTVSNVRAAGFVANNKKDVYFTVPLDRPVLISNGATVSVSGITLHLRLTGTLYTLASVSSTYAEYISGVGVYLKCTLTSAVSAGDVAIGVSFNGTFYF